MTTNLCVQNSVCDQRPARFNAKQNEYARITETIFVLCDEVFTAQDLDSEYRDGGLSGDG